jgi:hypothetical protein
MATLPSLAGEPCFADAPLAAQDVARGVTRLLFRQDQFAMCEVPLPNGRRADMMAICAKGTLTIVEIKVSRSDLLGDHKWPDYLDIATASTGRFQRGSRSSPSPEKRSSRTVAA